MLETILFYLFALGTIAFAVAVITARSAVYSVLSLVAAMCLMAGLFVLLKAFLVATILVLVYAGAILVLFLFVVMLVDFQTPTEGWGSFRLSPILAITLGIILFAQSFQVIKGLEIAQTPAPVQGTAESIGRLLFSHYVLPFELTSFLLLAAVVSVVVLAKKEVK